MINQKQIFFFKHINETTETSKETTTIDQQKNQINNYVTQTKIISTDSFINEHSNEGKISEAMSNSNIYTEKNIYMSYDLYELGEYSQYRKYFYS